MARSTQVERQACQLPPSARRGYKAFVLALDDDDLYNAIRCLAPNPHVAGWYLLDAVVRRNFGALAVAARGPLQFAYSVKTNPHAAMLAAARDALLYAEVIGPEELALARQFGFGSRTIYNGPVPAWRAGGSPGLVFADSLEAFVDNVRELPGALAGLRVRPRGIRSRFGIGWERFPDVVAAIRSTGCRRLGISFHVRPADYGTLSWREIVLSVIEDAVRLEAASGARIVTFDVGGGRTPLEFDRGIAADDFAWLVRSATSALPGIESVFAEPGQAVATPCGVLVAPVLERRSDEIVVAAGYPELSQIHTFAHRVFAVLQDGTLRMLAFGNERILGRTCLEYDVIRNDVRLPGDARIHAVVVADAGAYDYSMAFDFARGGNRIPHEFGAAGG